MRALLVAATLLATATPAAAAIISVTPTDNWTKIEAAKAGDIVEIAPGTYKFRVLLAQAGTPTSPITIRAKDPANRPVWDLGGQAVSAWPGSYTAGDKGRGCWQVSGANYVISGLVFKNCQDAGSAGLRAIDSGPVTIRDCLFTGNTNGLTGSAEGLVVEFSEFTDNGKLVTTGNMTHNIYIYGGVFALRYSYVHDPHEGQNFHIRARDAVIEYNWIARPSSYPGDLMSCNTLCGGTGTSAITQKMVLRGNVILQGAAQNLSQIIALYNDEPDSFDGTGSVKTMELTLEHNTVVGTPVAAGKTQRLVNMGNDTGITTKVHLSNNIFYQLASLYEVAAPASTATWSVDGKNNWAGATTVVGNVSGTIFGNIPGFMNAALSNYTLGAVSGCLGKAAPLATPPTKEYYRDETVKLQWRARASAKDVGAFELGTSSLPVGPYAPIPPPADGGPGPKDGGPGPKDGKPATKDGAATKDRGAPPIGDGKPAGDRPPWSELGGAGDRGGPASDGAGAAKADGGCGCVVGTAAGASDRAAALLLLLGACLALHARRRRSS